MANPFHAAPLPYPQDALSPIVSAQTINFHYEKHHKGYVDKLNDLVRGKPYAEMNLEEVVRDSIFKVEDKDIFHNAAQAWNHDFFWKSLTPQAPLKPSHRLTAAIERSFTTVDEFKRKFSLAANEVFGSGWAWLVQDKAGDLQIVKTANAGTPITQNLRPLLTLDLWEHAYYLDYQNRRVDYITVVVDRLLNWDFADGNLSD